MGISFWRPSGGGEGMVHAAVLRWAVKRGQLWQVGAHRLLCGDVTDPDEIGKLIGDSMPDLVFTDPPYGISIVKRDGHIGGGGIVDGKRVETSNYLPIQGDDSTVAARRFYENAISRGIQNFIIWGGNYFADFLPPSRCWIAWDKENGRTVFADIELAWTSFNRVAKLYKWLWNGLCRKGARRIELYKRVHPTQKPVGLHVEILEEFSKPGDLVLDGFIGSGTTVIACEIAGRRCYGADIEPAYVAVTLERLFEMGLVPQLAN